MEAPDSISYRERAAFYDVEYQDDADRPFLQSLVSERVRSVLELPCGAGRNALWLAETGREITCCDLEPAMLDALRARCPGGVAPANLTLAQADMRAFDLERRFDLIVIPREAIQLLPTPDDVASTLASCRRHLADLGTLVVDVAAFRAAPEDTPAVGYGLQPSYFAPGQPDGVECLEWVRRLPDGRRLERRRRQWDRGECVEVALRYRLHAATPGSGHHAVVSEWASSMTLRRYSMSQFRKLATAADLSIRAAYSTYDRRAYRDGDARMILLLQAASPETGHDGGTVVGQP